jgi:hypothetical protein
MFGRKKKPKMPGVPQQGIVTDETHLLSVGTPGTATIKNAYDSKIYADEIDGRMDPDSPMCTDPVWTVNLVVDLPDRDPYDVHMTMRVPHAAIPHLGGGTKAIIAAHPEHPDTTVAIDWSRFPAPAA